MMLRWRVGADTQRSWSSGTSWRHSQDMSKNVKIVISPTWNLVSASNTSSCLFFNMKVKVVKWIWLWQGFRNSTSIENLSCNPASPTLRKTLRSCWTTMRRKRSHMKRYANCKRLLKIDVCLWWPFETKKWCLFWFQQVTIYIILKPKNQQNRNPSPGAPVGFGALWRRFLERLPGEASQGRGNAKGVEIQKLTCWKMK